MTRNVVRVDDLKPPRAVTDEDLELICRTFHIPKIQHDEVRNFLADAVAGFRRAIDDQRKLPSRKDDRLAITRAIYHLRRAEHLVKQIKGPAGRRALRVSGRQIAPAVSDAWLQRHFPNDFEAPSEVYRVAGYNPLRPSMRDPGVRPSLRDSDWLSEAENRSLDNRVDFMGRWGGTAIAKLLANEITALEGGRRSIVHLPDGRKPLTHRAYMLAALAELWRGLGRRPTSGANSQFGAFCEVVFRAIGWPTEGVSSALPDAIKLWRARYH
jgi:hypothetical protein